jgi:hypothetical protein
MESRNIRTRLITSMALVIVVTIALMLPAISYAFSPRPVGFGDGSVGNGYIARAGGSTTVISSNNGQLTTTTISPNSNGYTVTTTTYNGNANPLSQVVTTVGKAQQYAFTTYNTQTTITKTYTQYVYYTTVVTNTINNYLMPILKWEFTLVNIGQYQAQGYHSVGNQLVFTPGSGGSGIFVPVFSQEAIYNLNIAPSTKPVVTGWYTAGQSQYSTSSTTKSATPPQLTSIQDTVNTMQQLATVTIPNITRSSVNWIYNTQPGTTIFVPYTPKPYYYSKQDIQGAYSTAWSDLTHGDVLGAIYQAGRGAYMQTWNALAGAVFNAYKYTLSAMNAWNTATLAKSVGLGFGTITSYVSSLLTHL